MHMAPQVERLSRFVWRLVSVGIVVFLIVSGFAATQSQPASEDWKVFDRPGKFITALCATDEALWIGTEDRGLWRLDLSADPGKPGAWKQFIGKDGPNTEHVYAIAVDAAGRVWVGTVNQGVAVYNGAEWRTFGVLDGCAGERVFAIAADADSKRGHVWIGTDQGLVCWSPDAAERGRSPTERSGSPEPPRPDAATSAPGTWRTYTRADGLPSDQIYALAVAPTGRVWVGTECDGLAWSDPPYKKWTCVRAAAERSGDEGEAPGLAGGTGPGLPSNLSNDLLVLRDGTVVYSTNYGLGMGRGGGLTWTSWQGLLNQPYANYCRGLAEDPSGRLWIATRHLGLARLDGRSGELKSYRRAWRPESKPAQAAPNPLSPPRERGGGEGAQAAPRASLPDDYVFDVAVTADGDVWAGTYGGGLARLRGAASDAAPRDARPASAPGSPPGLPGAGRSQRGASPAANPPLPAPAAPPTLAELNALLADLARVPFVPPEKQPAVIRLDDDWLTRGDCLGRYGRYWGCWCAICSPEDYIWGAGPENIEYRACIGQRWWRHDSIRNWIHWLFTNNINTLEMPPTYYDSSLRKKFMRPEQCRRQADWDDHGEVYSISLDGPHLYCTLRIPPGLYTLSLYNFNKDGHYGNGNNRFRDYRLSIRPHPADRPLREIEGFENRPELARGRMRDFWGGAYKRFLVRGPIVVAIEVRRNHSFNTNLSGVFLDLVDEYPVPYFHTVQEWQAMKSAEAREVQTLLAESRAGGGRASRFRPGATAASSPPGASGSPPSLLGAGCSDAAVRCFEELERTRLWNPVWWATEGVQFYKPLLRWYLAALQEVPPGPVKQELYARAATCYYRLGLYEKWEAGQVLLGKTTARQTEKSIRWNGRLPDCRGKGFEIIASHIQNAKLFGTSSESR